MTRIWLFIGLVLIVLSSCVPAKRLVYLQKDDELKRRGEIPKDTVLRSHKLSIQEYRIQPLDLLSIQFETVGNENDAFDFLKEISPAQTRGGGSNVGNAAAANGVLVHKEGYIEYPVLGKIFVAGLTPFEAADTIKAVTAKFLADVIVRVRMLNFRFTVLGEVNGEQTVLSANTRLTLMEAVGLAGGLSELADRSNVKVIRQNGENTEIHYIDLLKEDFLESPYYWVKQNDVIIVPPLKQRTFRRYFVGNIAIVTSTISFVLLIVSLTR